MIRFHLQAATLAASMLITASAAQGQLNYSHTALVHGFGSSSGMWTSTAAELGSTSPQQYFAARVDLGLLYLPNWSPETVFSTEWQAVRDRLAGNPGRYVFAGHSTGGLVSRYAYLNGGTTTRDRMAAILTIATPHQGAILADSAQRMGEFAHDLKKKIDAANVGLKFTIVGFIVLVMGAFFGVAGGAAGLLSLLFINFPSVTSPDQLLKVGTLPALSPSSSFVTALNTSGSFDASIPRANIVGRLDNNKFMPLKLAAAFRNVSEQQQISEFQKGRSAFAACKNVGAFTIIGVYAAVKCSEAERMMGRLDETWQRFSSGSSPQQVCRQVWYQDGPRTVCSVVPMPRLDLPTDGVVPNERSLYPSRNAGQFWESPPVIGTNHMTVYRRPNGADRIVEAMLDRFGMRQPAPPPPPSGGSSLAPSPYYVADFASTLISSSNVHGGLQFGRVYWQDQAWINGVWYAKALGMHAPASGVGTATFQIPVGAKNFWVVFGYARVDGSDCYASNDKGSIYVDGQVVWSDVISGSINSTARYLGPINVDGRSTLRFEVDALGDNYCAHTTWGDPRFEG